jgi:hypothetical protein
MSVADEASRASLEEYVRLWPPTYAGVHGIDARDELSAAPHVVRRAADTFDVVFDGRAGSRLWKDLMVHLLRPRSGAPSATGAGDHG